MKNPTRLVPRLFGEERTIILLISFVVLSTTCQTSPRSSYALFHRLGPSLIDSYSTNNETAYEWQKRAVLEISTPDSEINLENNPLHHVKDLNFVVSSFVKNTEPIKIPPSSIPLESLDYQITLVPQDSQELPGDSGHPDTEFAITSYPLCAFLSDRSSSKRGPLNEYLNIWIRPTSISSSNLGSQPSSMHNLQLDLLGIQWSYSTPLSSSSSPYHPLSGPRSKICDNYFDHRGSSISKHSDQQSLIIKSRLMEFINNYGNSPIKVSVRRPEKLVEPILKPYPTHKNAEYLPDGTVKEPGPEKGFLAKYWMYILPVVVLLVMGGGPPPDENGDQPQATERSN